MSVEEMKKKLASQKHQGMSAMGLYASVDAMKEGPVLVIDPKGNIDDLNLKK